MTSINMLQRFFIERNTSESTRKGYVKTIQQLETLTGLNVDEMIQIAKTEKQMNWEDQQLRQWLILFRNYVYSNFKEGTARLKLTFVKAVFHHFNIRTDKLPYFSNKQVKKSEVIDYEDLPNREILKKCINMDYPILRALTLLMSSSGLSKIDAWKLTIADYMKATYEYHKQDNIYAAIEIMNQSDVAIIPSFKMQRQKTGETYRTFASNEAVNAINIYLLSREDKLNSDSQLFQISMRYINDLFSKVNDKLGLGRVNGNRRFTPQMLRSYHASQLSEAGMTDSMIDLLQGRKPSSIARKHYIRVKREKLKEEYIRCLPYIVVEDIEEVKTELDVVKEENTNLKQDLNNIYDRLEKLEANKPTWNEFIKKEK